MTKLFWMDNDRLLNYRTAVYRSKRWKATRAYVLSDSPYCAECKRSNRLTPATDVDHITPLSAVLNKGLDPEMAFDVNNLQPICKKCHGQKTYTEGFGKGRKVKEKPKGVIIKNGIISNFS